MRKSDLVPGIIYGYQHDSIPISIDKETLKLIVTNQEVATPFEVVIDKESFPVVVKDIQKDVLTEEIIHVDLLLAKPGHAITFKIPVRLHGVSIAVKNGWGVIMQALDYVTVKALPEKILSQIDIIFQLQK